MAGGLRSNKMVIDDDIKNYFTNLIKPLVTNNSLQQSLDFFKDENVNKLEEKIKEQDVKIKQLESNLKLRQNTVDVLLEKLEIKSDDNEQYSRRSCVRINRLEVCEDNENMVETLKTCFEECEVPFEPSTIDRAHRIGTPYNDKESGKKVQSIIVKFSSWSSRSRFYKSRPRSFINGKKKLGLVPFKVSLDLTKRRFELLNHAREVVKENTKVSYVYTDINCNLVLKSTNNKFHHFNSVSELVGIINKL